MVYSIQYSAKIRVSEVNVNKFEGEWKTPFYANTYHLFCVSTLRIKELKI